MSGHRPPRLGPALRLVVPGHAGDPPGSGTTCSAWPGAAGQAAAASVEAGRLTPLARLQVEQAREALETLSTRARGADLATAMLLVGEATAHTRFLLDLVDALTL
jgi:hypothetical protein